MSNSNNRTSTSMSSSISYSSSSSSSHNGQTTGHRHVQHTYTDNNGTTVHRSTQNLGEPEVRETRHYDNQGRELLEGGNGNGSDSNEQRRIEDVTDEEQAERDREYEERMEDEYAKREGGA